MRLYSGSSEQFIDDAVHNQIAEKLKIAHMQYFRYWPSDSEIRSWKNSLRALSQVFQYANLMDHGILLEYQLPLTSKRLDCLICGKDKKDAERAVIIELKQWEKAQSCADSDKIMTFVGGANREVLHPSVQVGQYRMYLGENHTAFYSGKNPIMLDACSYLHNYSASADDALFEEKFKSYVVAQPVFTENKVDSLKDFLVERLVLGHGIEVLRLVERSKYRPSKKLMDHVGNVIKGKPEYVLLDNQLLVYDKVFSSAKRGFHDKQKRTIIIKGGPGTGKSVIAINLMADLMLKGYHAQYATGSRAFTQTLRKAIGTRGAPQFKYFNDYVKASENEIDVLICDEAHRIREKSRKMYQPVPETYQVEEIINASKVSVFLIDDDQIVRPDEIGSVDYIREYAKEARAEVLEYELDAQFRCNGSEGFVNWVNNTLGIKRTANVIWDRNEEFDFQIVGSPQELEAMIKKKVAEGNTGRVTAGYCWPWSPHLNEDGTLKEDVVIGDYKRPWNARPEARGLASNIPKAPLWAYDSNGINQIGCIYTAQGFEFDYVGVIFGKDLVYDLKHGGWIAHKKNSHDSQVKRSKDHFMDLVKNTYRVLMTRGMKGCYVYFMDEETEKFVRSRIEN
ncbi:MAG: DUF2075 domain-containing protein [Candidatus Altiarchaeota archaeon]|nr:DUF2075 domain-containing protein [Candidatus Altiarchaeota archaeon]